MFSWRESWLPKFVALSTWMLRGQKMKAAVPLLLVFVAMAMGADPLPHVSCVREYKKVGCFYEDDSFPMLFTDRSMTSPNNRGHKIEWTKWEIYIHSLACRCNEAAKARGFNHFALRYYGLCYGVTKDDFPGREGNSNCLTTAYQPCDDNSDAECVGIDRHDYIYELGRDGNYSEWSEFSTCSKSCGGGTQARVRYCINPRPSGYGKNCSLLGSNRETMVCNNKSCEVDGGFSEWTPFGPCNQSCGGGVQRRSRQCNNPLPSEGGKDCVGALIEEKPCNNSLCPIDGGFSPWSAYSSCSKSCGGGLKTRTRQCNNPVPAHGGKYCSGAFVEEMECNTNPCPVDGGFSNWSAYSNCSKSCGGGLKTRTRQCNNPVPANGGKNCSGAFLEEMECNVILCPVDGGFSPWSAFGNCSKACGGGLKSRSRQCNNPSPAHGGKHCSGAFLEEKECNTHHCPVDGGFSQWSAFSNCSKSCGGGLKSRSRQCNNPAPAHGGKHCSGAFLEEKECNRHHCPVDGGFSQWTTFSNCSKICGGGLKSRTRQCNNPMPAHGGKNCTGALMDEMKCNINTCPVDGGFSQWSKYGACSKTCGGGVITKFRQCNNPKPAHGGKNCSGAFQETKACKNDLCAGPAGISKAQELVEQFLVGFHNSSYPGKAPSGKFQQAIFAIQKSVANEFALGTTKKNLQKRLDDLKKFLKVATEGGSIDFARVTFGKSLFVFMKKKIEDGLPIDEMRSAVSRYLESVKKSIGADKFGQLMLENGAATLIFTIDTTGSMKDEIFAAKGIANAIIRMQRKFPVDYILSPFNDPGYGPVTHKNDTTKKEFITAIQNLRAYGGRDCPELSFTGMLEAYKADPQLGSPMFVFTDASAKDDTPEKKEELKTFADQYGTTINFFINKLGCGGAKGIKSYQEIASYTSGQIFPLKTHAEITQFTSYVKTSLKSGTTIAKGAFSHFTSTGKRSLTTLSSFYVDSTVETLIITLNVMQQNTARMVMLTDSSGKKYTAQSTTAYNQVYTIEKPKQGKWLLSFPVYTGAHSFIAKAHGDKNVEFVTYFMHQERPDGPVLAIANPLKGKKSSLAVQISGMDLLNPESLKIHITNDDGGIIQRGIALKNIGGTAGIFHASINTPSGKFKVSLTGTTKKGSKFQRLSHASFEAKNAVMTTISAGNEFTAEIHKGMAEIKIYMYNQADAESYRFAATSSHGSVSADAYSLHFAKGTNQTVSFTYFLPRNAASMVGKTDTIVVTATGESTGSKTQATVVMLYVK